jgi:excisionase family DNA binding protein
MAEEKQYLSIPGHVSVKEAADMLGLSEDRVWEYIRDNRLPAHKVDGRYMIPRDAVESFHRKPHGRVRSKPVAWRSYRAGATVKALQIEVRVLARQREDLQTTLQAILEQQQHLFPGTMQRYLFARVDDPDAIVIQLVWKDTELTDEEALERDLEAFRAAFAELLDWPTARYERLQAMLHT